MLFDTHLHLIYPEELSYPWLANVAALNRPSRYEDYHLRARKLGITGCLHMEVDVAADQITQETELIAGLARKPESLIHGAISACRPEDDGFAGFLDAARRDPLIRGFRRILHEMPDDLSTTQTFRDNVKRLSGTGLSFDICALPHQLPIAAELVDHCPDVQFVLDHCGVPAIAAGADSPWRENMAELAKRPNIVGKISGVIAYADPGGWSLDDIRPWVAHTAEVFGPDRLVWGSDSPVCNLGGGLETWVAVTRALTEDWSRAERDALYHGNATRIWRL